MMQIAVFLLIITTLVSKPLLMLKEWGYGNFHSHIYHRFYQVNETQESLQELSGGGVDTAGINLTTAIVGLVAAVISLLTAWITFAILMKRNRKKQIRESNELNKIIKELEEKEIESCKEIQEKVSVLLSFVSQSDDQMHLRSILSQLHMENEPEEIVSLCQKISVYVRSDVSSEWNSLLKMAVQIIAIKCTSQDEAVSESAFNALAAVCQWLGKNSDLDLSVFEKLLADDNYEHVKRSAIFELCTLCKDANSCNQDERALVGGLLMPPIDRLIKKSNDNDWSETEIRLAKSIISSLKFLKESPHIINSLFPSIVHLIKYHSIPLLESFLKTLQAIDLNQLDKGIKDSIYSFLEDDLLKREDVRSNDKIINKWILPILRLLNPKKSKRKDPKRYKLPRIIEIFDKEGEKVLTGSGINASPNGFCIEVSGTLLGDRDQARNENQSPFKISDGKEYEIGKALMSIHSASGTKDDIVKLEIETLRAWRSADRNLVGTHSGFAGKIAKPTAEWHAFVAKLPPEQKSKPI